MTHRRLEIERLGQRGEGVAQGSEGPLFVPFALPGEIVALAPGERGEDAEIVVERADRLAPVCAYYGTCGGCAVQTLPQTEYAEWKRGLVATALRKHGIDIAVEPLVAAHGDGRRRATFHARAQVSPNVLHTPGLRLGFMRARSHEVVDIQECPVLAPSLAPALPASRRLAVALQNLGKPIDVVATATLAGLDLDLRGTGPIGESDRRRVGELAASLDLARLSNHGDIIVERRQPCLKFGSTIVVPPPGAFLQATLEGETAMAAFVCDAVGSARKVADLFCGLGTFALRLAERATVAAIDIEGPSLAALSKAARQAPHLRPVTVTSRDLFRTPVPASDMQSFDAVVFDPPRAGAAAQAAVLATSTVRTIVGVSCNPTTFAQDAAILIAGGYNLERVVPIDQFLFSPHVELVGIFRRAKMKGRSGRRLFG